MSEPSLRYDRPPRPFRFRYFAGWTVQEDVDTLSLWKSPKGGAITMSSVVNDDPGHVADALVHARRFAQKNAGDPPRVEGTRDVAVAAFTDHEGAWVKARVLAAGPRVVLATYTTGVDDPAEEAEVDAILASLELA